MRLDTPSYAFSHATYYSDRVVPTQKDGSPLKVNLTPTQKTGIKVYGFVLGWILSLFGVTIALRDAHNRIYFVNKKSLIGWASTNGANQTLTWRELNDLLHNVYRAKKIIEAKEATKPDPYDEKTECPLCFEEKVLIEMEECKHKFCVVCIKDWAIDKKKGFCPMMDNSTLTPNDIQKITSAASCDN